MQEDIHNGKYVSLNYVYEGVTYVECGKLEKVVFDDDGAYKILFSEIYNINKDGKYELSKNDTPVIKSIPPEMYRGLNPETKASLKKDYNERNRKIDEYNDSVAETENDEITDDPWIYRSTNMGFTSENTEDSK